MKTPTMVKNHPLHPILVAIPIGLWIFSFTCQLIARFSGFPETWLIVAFYCAGGGMIGALLAAIPGFVDYFSLTDPHLKRTATNHMIANFSGIVVWATAFYLMMPGQAKFSAAFFVSLIGIGILGYAGWLGGDLVHGHGVAVEVKSPSVSRSPDRRAAASASSDARHFGGQADSA